MIQDMKKLTFHGSLGQSLQQIDAVEVPLRGRKESERLHVQLYIQEHRHTHACHLLHIELHILQADQRRVELTPQGIHRLVAANLLLQFLLQGFRFLLASFHLQTQRSLLVLDDGQGALSHLELLLKVLKRCLIILKLDCHCFS